MYILAIETTGPVGSVALMRLDGKDQARNQAEASAEGQNGSRDEAHACDPARIPMKVTTRTMSHLKNLMAMTEELFEEEKVERSEICAVAASCGPGSFTGIRIGVSTARALAQAWGVPCIKVPTLEVFKERTERDGKPVCVIFNARRGQVYGACYGKDGETLIEPGPYMLSDMLSRIETLRISPVFYGDGVDAYFDKEEYSERVGSYETSGSDVRYQTADMAARYAADRWEAGDTIEYGELLPEYMRESEAEQRLKDGSLEQMRKAKLERLMRMAGKDGIPTE